MSRPSLSQAAGALALALTVGCSAAAADTLSISGAPAGHEGPSITRAPLLPAGLDDLLHPLAEPGAASAAPAPDACDPAAPEQPAHARVALWQHLADLAPGDRSAATIDIEPLARGGTRDAATAAEVASLWNRGRHAEAIDALRTLEATGAPLAMGLSSARGGVCGGVDVRVGSPRTYAWQVDLDYDTDTGHVFGVVGWNSTTDDAWWTVNLSTDHGASWAETFEWYTTTGLNDVDGAVVGDWFYVGYVSGTDGSEVRVRRFRISDGGMDYDYGYKTVLDAGASYFTEVLVVSNADDFDNRIYFIALQHYFDLRFVWATDDGGGFTELEVPETVSVATGLSATWGYQYDCTDFIFISYAGTDRDIHVLRRSPDEWTDTIVDYDVSSNSETGVSVYGTNVICAYETPMTYGTGIAYRTSYDCGSGWAAGSVATPGGPGIVNYVNPAVDARNGQGTAIVYQNHAADGDSAFYRCRVGFAPGVWSDPAVFSDHDVFSGLDMGLSPLSSVGDPFDLGVIYVSHNSRIPYFDQPGLDASSVPDLPASASTLRLLPASPNPFREQTALRFELPAAAHARVELFDLPGRYVATLLDEEVEAGPHEVSLAGRGLPSGLYVFRLTAGTETGSGQLIRLP